MTPDPPHACRGAIHCALIGTVDDAGMGTDRRFRPVLDVDVLRAAVQLWPTFDATEAVRAQ
jgi:hypothetical protein